jgi:hypothetical protein
MFTRLALHKMSPSDQAKGQALTKWLRTTLPKRPYRVYYNQDNDKFYWSLGHGFSDRTWQHIEQVLPNSEFDARNNFDRVPGNCILVGKYLNL